MSDLFNPPDPPNPLITSMAQTGSNINTAVANAYLGNVNQNTPYGSLRNDVTGMYQWTDPTTFQTYSIPQFTQTQTLSPWGQATQEQTDQGRYTLAALAKEQTQRMYSQFQNPLNIAGAPAFGDPNRIAGAQQAQTAFGGAGAPISGFGDAGAINNTFGDAGQVDRTFANTQTPIGSTFGAAPATQTQFGAVGGPTYGFGGAGDITKTYEDFASERNRIEAGLMERLQPSLEQERAKYEQQLADQGIRYGSQAYENAMRNYSMQANDARLGVIGQAGSEQQRMADMAAQRAGFENAAQQQEFMQAQARGQFYNTAQQQAYGQELGRGQFANQAAQQIYEQALGRGQFANSAQQQEFLQALSRGEFTNKAQQQMYEQALGRGEFANTAQQQIYEQLFGRGQFYNAGQQQLFSQEAARGTFANAALAQNFGQSTAAFNAQNAQRQQWLNEQFALRNQPINEISALMTGSQVQQPNFLNTNMPNIANTDVAGILNNNFNQQMQVSNQQAALANQVIGGLFGFGGQMARAGAFGGG